MGKLVSHSKAAHGGLSADDVRCDDSVVRLFIRRSKTAQAGMEAHIELHQIQGSFTCPVKTVMAYLKLRPAVAGSFLVHSDGLALSEFQFISILRRCLSAAGVEASLFQSHSFRIGAATEAVWTAR